LVKVDALLKTPLLKDKPNGPAPDRLRLPDWWPGASTDRGKRNQRRLVIVTTFIGAVILLASNQNFWGVFCGLFLVALGIFLLVIDRRLRAAERMLDEAERRLRLDEPATNDRDPYDDMNR
jgi:hypothetical protein